MNRHDFLRNMTSPLPKAILKKWPKGNIVQHWAENPALYSAASGRHDALHTYLGGHTGIDIATGHRDPVYAAHDGYVPAHMIFDDPGRAGGREVWVYSDPLDDEEPQNSLVCTVYCHLDEIVVKPGQRVSQGQLLGYEGNTGFVVSGGTKYWGNAPAGKGTHLHFGLYELILKNGQWAQRAYNVLKGSSDPLPYISETPENPHGDLSGFTIVLNNAAKYLAMLAGK